MRAMARRGEGAPKDMRPRIVFSCTNRADYEAFLARHRKLLTRISAYEESTPDDESYMQRGWCAICDARMPGENMLAIGDAHLVRIGEHRQRALDLGVRNRVIVQIETNIGCLANPDRPLFEQRIGMFGQRQQPWRLLGEDLADAAVLLTRTASICRLAEAPGPSLGI